MVSILHEKTDMLIWALVPRKNYCPGGSDSKESACNAGDLGLIPGSGRSPGEGKGNPLQSSCLENFMTEEPDGLQSIGLQKVRHNSFHTFTKWE